MNRVLSICGILALVMGISSCVHGPKIPWYIWSNDRMQFEGVTADGKAATCKPPDPICSNLVATTPNGFDQLTTYINDKCNP